MHFFRPLFWMHKEHCSTSCLNKNSGIVTTKMEYPWESILTQTLNRRCGKLPDFLSSRNMNLEPTFVGFSLQICQVQWDAATGCTQDIYGDAFLSLCIFLQILLHILTPPLFHIWQYIAAKAVFIQDFCWCKMFSRQGAKGWWIFINQH